MSTKLDILTLESLERHRGLGEHFQDALREVVSNIEDPNFDGKPRGITITLTFKPSEDRQFADVGFEVASKLRPRTSGHASVVIRDGAAEIRVDAEPGDDPRQGTITSISAGKKGAGA